MDCGTTVCDDCTGVGEPADTGGIAGAAVAIIGVANGEMVSAVGCGSVGAVVVADTGTGAIVDAVIGKLVGTGIGARVSGELDGMEIGEATCTGVFDSIMGAEVASCTGVAVG